MVDIGDRVRAGQPLAEIEAPELDDRSARPRRTAAGAGGAGPGAGQSRAGQSPNLEFARVTAERWSTLVAKGVVSRQENDQYQAQYRRRSPASRRSKRPSPSQRSNVAAAEANLARLDEVQGYRVVKAPFDGVITLRNVDVGRAGERRQHAAVSHRADRYAAHLRQRPADQCRFHPARPTRAIERFRICPGANSPARWRAPRTRSIPPAARCWWRSRCRIRMARCCPACTLRSI